MRGQAYSLLLSRSSSSLARVYIVNQLFKFERSNNLYENNVQIWTGRYQEEKVVGG